MITRGRTCIISANGSLHDGLHPVSNNRLLVRAEKVHLIVVVLDPESVSARIHVFVDSDFVTQNVDITLDLGLL